jgi:hypothetical protein
VGTWGRRGRVEYWSIGKEHVSLACDPKGHERVAQGSSWVNSHNKNMAGRGPSGKAGIDSRLDPSPSHFSSA